MKQLSLIIVVIYAIIGITCTTNAQVQKVNAYIDEVQRRADQVNQLANSKKVYEAVKELNSLKRDLDSYVNYYFEDEYRAALQQNPSYTFYFQPQISKVLTASYWEDRVKRNQKSIKNCKEAFYDVHNMRTLDRQDQAWTYLKTTYDGVKTIKDVVESITKQEYYDAVKNAKEGIDGFIDNYKKIEEARLQIINTDLYETEVKGLIRRAERMEEACWQFASFMRAWEDEVDEFYAIVSRMNSMKQNIKAGPIAKLEYSNPDFVWETDVYMSKLDEFGQELLDGQISLSQYKSQVQQLKRIAANDCDQIILNINSTDDENNKPAFLSQVNDNRSWFDREYDRIKNQYESNSNTSANHQSDLFGGSSANGSSNTDNEQDQTSDPFYLKNVSFENSLKDYGGGKTYVDMSFDVIHKQMFGIIVNIKLDGQQITQNTRSKPIITGYSDVNSRDFTFALPSDYSQGQHTYELLVDVGETVLTNSGSFTIDGNAIIQNSGNAPTSTIVNTTGYNSGQDANQGQVNTGNWVSDDQNTNDTQNTWNNQTNNNPNTSNTNNSGTSSYDNTSSSKWELTDHDDALLEQFNALLDKAEDAFDNAPGYQEAANTASGNPMEKPARIMRQAKGVAQQMENPTTKFISLFRVVYSYAQFAKRVYAYQYKSGFIEDAGQTLSHSAGLIPSIRNSIGGMSASKLRAYCYEGVADAWRELTKAALWGDHQFNKMYCDQQAKKYYELALNEDRSNEELKKTVEKINAPKKPVPAIVKASKPIPENSWAEAEQLRQAMVADTEVNLAELPNTSQNYSELAMLHLDVGGGTVKIRRSGAANWERVDGTTPVFQGDVIRTSSDAKDVSVTFSNNNSCFVIKPDAEVLFGLSKMVIKYGSLLLDVSIKGEEFLVITPTCSVGVRGTSFGVDVKKDQKTEVKLIEGVVEVRNEHTISYLEPGQKVIAEAEKTEMPVTQFDVNTYKKKEWTAMKRPSNNSNTSNTNPDPFAGSNSGGSSPPEPNVSVADIWSMETYGSNLQNFEQKVSAKANSGMVPIGLSCNGSQFEVLYLGGDLINISAWNMEWYNDANSLQQGINNNMNQGYIPTGFSWSGSAYYVLYIKSDMTGLAWQIVPSALDLNAVSNAIQPWVNQNYLPMGISIFGQEYYTLLVQFSEPLANSWNIEGYHDNKSEISKAINSKINNSSIPWGILKNSGVANVLYVGF